MAALIELDGIERHFPGGDAPVKVLKNIRLRIAAGEMVAIIGQSGSGKSTLMNILGCLDRASAGTYRLGGQNVAELDPDQLATLRRERLGFVFQRYHLLPHLSASGNVEVPAIYAGVDRAARHARAVQLLSRLGMADKVGNKPSQLSGGQQQRVSIARALMNGGQIILADEPTGALDRQSGREVLAILRELNAQGHTVILVTHDAQVAAQASRIVEIVDGEIVSDRANPDFTPHGAEAETAPARPLHPGLASRLGLFNEAFKMAWKAMVSNRLRTLLTMLGIVIGITSVVSIVALGTGAQEYMVRNLTALGAPTVDVLRGQRFGDDKAAGIRTFLPGDLAALHQESYVDSATPQTNRTYRLRYRNVDVNASAQAVSAEFFRVKGYNAVEGGLFTDDDVRRQAQVIVIDPNGAKQLFGDRSGVGEVILVGNLPMRVIGVARQFNDTGDSENINLWMPYSTAASRLLGQQHFDRMTIRLQPDTPSELAEAQITELLTRRHGSTDFFLRSSDQLMQTINETTKNMTMILSLVAFISLVVGGIGVMNIMLVSVTERTREIGIRMAVGARQSDVLQQFMTEAVLVCLAGGVVGIGLSYLIGFIVGLVSTEWSMVFSVGSFVVAFACSTLIGVVFGFMPARSAARLEPIEALARE